MTDNANPEPEMKPRFPENPPSIEVPLILELGLDFDRYSSGSMLMTLADTTINVSDPKTGEKLGEIGMAIGGTFFVNIGSGVSYRLKFKHLEDLFRGVQAAHKKSVEDEAVLKKLLPEDETEGA